MTNSQRKARMAEEEWVEEVGVEKKKTVVV